MPNLRDQLQATLSGTYTLERELGGGGMARVFLADELHLGRKVVVKVLSPELAAGLSAERFQREIHVAASLQQANIVPVLSAGELRPGGDGAPRLPYYTMPFVDGESLRDRLRSHGALPIPEALGILRDVARALGYAHEHGIVHRDIKPDNVLLSHGAAVVTDFGIAKAIQGARTEGRTAGPTLTQLGMSIGTPAYMAPEQATGEPTVDHRADFYSFGCMAYELLTGRPPFHDRATPKVLAAQLMERPAPVSEARPDTPPALALLVGRCLEKEPDQRPQSAAELVAVLDAVTSGQGGPALPAILFGGPGMLQRALLLYAGACVSVAVLAKAAIIAIGLPDWVLPGALIVMALGLPVILATGYVQRVMTRISLTTPGATSGNIPGPMPWGTLTALAVRASPHLSWRRTMLGGVWALGTFVFAIGLFMLLREVGIGPAGSLLARGKLARHEPLLVADFTMNGSADTALAGVVAEAVRAGLGESNAVTVVPSSAIRSVLTLMQRPLTSRLDPGLAREVAQRQGVRAVVTGGVTPLGAGYVVSARLVSAESGDELASIQETAGSPTELIPTVGRLTRALRERIGESLRNVNKTQPLEQVTTPSLEALRKYDEGARAVDNNDFVRGVDALKQAVEIDSTFAMAWRKLAVAYFNGRMPRTLLNDAATRAYRFRDRLSDRERYNTIAFYYDKGPEPDRARAAQAYDDVIRLGGIDFPAINNLAGIYSSRRQYARAESLYRVLLAHGNSGPMLLTNLLGVVFMQGRRAEAESLWTTAVRRFGESGIGVEPYGAELAYDRGQLDSARSMLEHLAGDAKPTTRAGAHLLLSGLLTTHGQLAAAHREWVHSLEDDAALGVPYDTLSDAMNQAWLDGWVRGQPAHAVQELDEALARTPLRAKPLAIRPYYGLAILYAQSGRPDRARNLLAQADTEASSDAYLRTLRPERERALAEIALAERRPLDALRLFRSSAMLPDGPASECAICDDVDVARAFDQAGAADSAVFYFERFFATPANYRMAPRIDGAYAAGAHKRLGELYEAKGDRARAASHYAHFVDLWKDADPELQPRVLEVRKRLVALSREG